jgi:putative transposase
MQLTFRYRIKGSSAKRRLLRMAAAVNTVWNYCNDAQRHAVRWGRKWPSGYDLNAQTANCAKELGLHSQTVQAIGQQYAKSRDQYGKRRLRYRGKRTLGWIPFKASGIRHRGDEFHFLGQRYRVWLPRPLGGTIRCGSFAQDALGHWYINVCCEVGQVASACGQGAIGIDLGLKTVAALSNGDKEDGGRHYRAIESALAIAQRAHKKRRVAALHAKAKNRRQDAHHKFSTRVVRENQLIAVGDVNSAKLAKTRLAKSVHDAAWSMLRTMLRYKALAHGARYVEVDEYESTQICSNCGCKPDSRPRGIADLGIREWICSDCGAWHDRDVNAARNILALGSQRPAEGILAL